MSTSVHSTEETVANELVTLEAMVQELEDYIIDGEVYRTVLVTSQPGADRGGNYRVEMSGGDVLARIDTLQKLRTDLPGELKDKLNSVITQFETTKHDLKSRFHDVLRRELAARQNTSRWADDERKDEEDDDDRVMPAEQHNRHCIAMIRQELG